jgi:hypothetical protein
MHVLYLPYLFQYFCHGESARLCTLPDSHARLLHYDWHFRMARTQSL